MSGRVRGPGRARVAEVGSSPWWPAADVVVLGVLVTAGSLLLVPTYGSLGPLLAVALGAVISLIAIVVVDRFRIPRWLAVPAITVGVVVFGSLLVAPRLSVFGFLPSPIGMSRVLRGSIEGWRDLLTVAIPTGVAGALLVPPLLIGAVGTAVAGVLATTRRPALALLAPAAALILFALLGSGQVDSRAAIAVAGLFVAAGVSWAVWVGSRTRRRTVARGDESPGGRRGGPKRTAQSATRHILAARRLSISAVVLVVAVVVGAVTAGAATPGRTALREVIDLPTDPTTFVSPLTTFRQYTKDRAAEVQLTATGLPAGGRLRLAALDAYDGRQFTLSNTEGPFVRVGRQLDPTNSGDLATVHVVVQHYTGLFLPLPGPIVELDFTGPRTTAHTEDLRYSTGAATGLMPSGWFEGDRYSVTAVQTAQPTADELAATLPLAAPFPTTVALPDVVRAAANRYVGSATGAAEQVEAIRAGLAADGAFSHGATGQQSPAGHGLDRMVGMITGPKMIGDQEQYAALMALMVRSIGLPARVAVGFVAPAATSPEWSSDSVDLSGADISAWVEVPFEGFGWVAFDPSPAPDKPPTPEQEQSSTQRRTVNVDVPPAAPAAQPDSVDAANAKPRPTDAEPDTAATQESGWLGWVVIGLGWALLVLAIAAVPICAILLVKGVRRRRRRSADQPKDQVTGGWEQLLDVAADAGYRPKSWHTRTEAAADLQTGGVLVVDWLAPAADAAEFSPSPVSSERALGYWREVDDRSAELLGSLPLLRRWRARLSLASLRRADRRAPGH